MAAGLILTRALSRATSPVFIAIMDPQAPTLPSISTSSHPSPRVSQDMPRTPVSQRLGSLFSSRAASPAPTTAGPSASYAATSAYSATIPGTRQSSSNSALRRQDSSFSTPSSPLHSTRRLGKEAERRRSHPASRRTSGVDSATRDALREALADESFDYSKRSTIVLTEPPQARLTSTAHLRAYASLQSGQSLRHPILLDSLSRSTFPSLLNDTHLQPQISPTPNVTASAYFLHGPLASSPPRSSIDSLRSLKEQNDRAVQKLQSAHVHTTARLPPIRGSTIESFTPSLPTNWWFNNKKDVDHLLGEEDQAETAEETGDKIRRRCE